MIKYFFFLVLKIKNHATINYLAIFGVRYVRLGFTKVDSASLLTSLLAAIMFTFGGVCSNERSAACDALRSLSSLAPDSSFSLSSLSVECLPFLHASPQWHFDEHLSPSEKQPQRLLMQSLRHLQPPIFRLVVLCLRSG